MAGIPQLTMSIGYCILIYVEDRCFEDLMRSWNFRHPNAIVAATYPTHSVHNFEGGMGCSNCARMDPLDAICTMNIGVDCWASDAWIKSV